MSSYDYGLDGPWETNRIRNPGMVQQMPGIHLPIKHSMAIYIAMLDGGFVLSLHNQGEYANPILCVGAESVEQGVRAILTKLVTGKLES